MKILLLTPPLIKTKSLSKLQACDDGDNAKVAIGLYSLASVLLENNYTVKLLNHTLTPWKNSLAEAVSFDPDLIGISCMTHNRVTALEWAEFIKKKLPRCPVVIGGVHATHLYQEILDRCKAIDFVAVGEGETSMLELANRLQEKDSTTGIPGIAGRFEDGSLDWPGRAEPILDLASLPVPAKHFSYSTLSSARGCPYQCTFCASSSMWGRRVREFPVNHVIDELKFMSQTHGLRQVHFKDETFTLRKSRVEEICQAMIEEKINLWWTCDTRVDRLDEERLYWMRKAGCFYVSLGIESGSPNLLESINKKTSLDQVYRATKLARQFGMLVRFYLIVGLPEETDDDLQATLDLVQKCQPNFISLANLSLSPGTEIFQDYCKRFKTNQSLWFDSKESIIPYDSTNQWKKSKVGRQLLEIDNVRSVSKSKEIRHPLSEDELRQAQQLVKDGFAPNYDLALYLFEAARFQEAIEFYTRALEIRPNFGKAWLDLGTCQDRMGQLPSAVFCWQQLENLPEEPAINHLIALIYRGLASLAQGDVDQAVELFKRAHKVDPTHLQPITLLAEKCAERNRWEDAMEASQIWCSLQPKEAQPYHILALGTWLKGNETEAASYFAKARKLAPANQEIQKNYNIFKQQRSK